MNDLKWIRIAIDIFENRKIRQIEKMPEGDAMLVIWIKLLCLAGETNDNGLIYLTREIPYTDDMLALQFDRPLNIVRMALSVFQRFGMIEIVDNFIALPSWEKYQSADKLEKIKEQNRLRKQRQRERQRLGLPGNVPQLPAGNDGSAPGLPAGDSAGQCHVTGHATITQRHAIEIEKEIELDKDIEIEEENDAGDESPTTPPTKKKSSRFVPPTLEEIRAYCEERGNGVDAARFYDYYTSTNWYRGKTKVKDWRACVRTWEQKEQQAPRYPARAQNERSRVKSEAEHARGGADDGFGWA